MGLLPGVVVLAGALCGLRVPVEGGPVWWLAVALAVSGWAAWWVGWGPATVTALTGAFFCAALALTADARDRALDTSLRQLLDREFGGFDIDTPGPGGRHAPLLVVAVLHEDATRTGDAVSVRALVTAVRIEDTWHEVRGTVALSVGGGLSEAHADQWRAGRTIEASVAFRRPTRYLNEGIADLERDLALGGITLFGSVKSALLVRVVSHGTGLQEAAAHIREVVRRRVDRWVARHDAVSAGIVTAVLIGDRSGLPEDVRLRLQAAGTYHVIAISGGNIAILVGLVLAGFYLVGERGRTAAFVTAGVLATYAQVVLAGPSVWRATAMAMTYLGARILDHRSPPWHTLALSAALVTCLRPLDVRDVGFTLTFGATAALLEGARRLVDLMPRHRVAAWLVTSIVASTAVELALMPVGARTFSRVTTAGLLLNLAAVPLMGLVQVAGIVVAGVGEVEAIASVAGWVAHLAADGLVESARLVELAPWLSSRVPPPPIWLVALYYAGLAGVLMARGATRATCAAVLCVSIAGIVSGQPTGRWGTEPAATTLRVTAFDVGQGDATLLQLPDRSTVLVDTGGTPFGGGGFDVGSRVLSPAMWALGLRRLDTLLLTHGDPDHIGGARSAIDDFEPATLWEGIPVPGHEALQNVLTRARAVGTHVARRYAGDERRLGDVRIRVLHPPVPDWERRRVRNDDSVVVEVVFGDVAVLLPGDVGAGIERAIVSQLTPARHRILKLAHHGSRTSSSRELIEGWRPQIAIASCGRGNAFGHPAPEVLERLDAIGAVVYRTDRDGQISIETDGATVNVRTFVGGPR